MARADLLCELIKYGLNNDKLSFRKAVEALCAEERAKQHIVLATKIEELLKASIRYQNFPPVLPPKVMPPAPVWVVEPPKGLLSPPLTPPPFGAIGKARRTV